MTKGAATTAAGFLLMAAAVNAGPVETYTGTVQQITAKSITLEVLGRSHDWNITEASDLGGIPLPDLLGRQVLFQTDGADDFLRFLPGIGAVGGPITRSGKVVGIREGGLEFRYEGKEVDLAASEQALGGHDLTELFGREVRLRFDPRKSSLEAVVESGGVEEGTWKVTQVGEGQIEVARDGHTKVLDLEDCAGSAEPGKDCTDLGAFRLGNLRGQEVRLRTDTTSDRLLSVVGGFPDDLREDFQAGVYIGLGIDTFAADDLRDYLNPDASSEIGERLVAGFDIAYRLLGGPDRPYQLWFYGETVHGMRSTDVDCAENMDLIACRRVPGLADIVQDRQSVGRKALYIIRNSTSLEGFAGLRLEFGRGLQRRGASPARPYLKV